MIGPEVTAEACALWRDLAHVAYLLGLVLSGTSVLAAQVLAERVGRWLDDRRYASTNRRTR